MLADIDRVGHTVLNGVFFDTDEAVVKPESKAALTEIATLLSDNPDLQAFVVGHTDMAGSLEHNMDLSERRAAAVVEALVAAPFFNFFRSTTFTGQSNSIRRCCRTRNRLETHRSPQLLTTSRPRNRRLR